MSCIVFLAVTCRYTISLQTKGKYTIHDQNGLDKVIHYYYYQERMSPVCSCASVIINAVYQVVHDEQKLKYKAKQ